jgi:hypothetical protein
VTSRACEGSVRMLRPCQRGHCTSMISSS